MIPRPRRALTDADLAGGHAAIPAFAADAPSSAWLGDDATVYNVLATKRARPPGRCFWPRLAVLAQLTAAIVAAPTGDLGLLLNRADLLLAQLAAELPTPNPAPWDPRLPGPLWSARWRAAQPFADLDACTCALAAFLLDPQPSSLDALAIVIDELAITLWMLHHLHATGRARRAER